MKCYRNCRVRRNKLDAGSCRQRSTMTDSADRSLPSWASPEISETNEEALKALQTYKKKDADKGLYDVSPWSAIPNLRLSYRSFQSGRKCPNNETKLFQNYSFEPIPSCDPVFTKGIRIQGLGTSSMLVVYSLPTSTRALNINVYAQHTYINLAFSPAPDDTVANLFKVCTVRFLESVYIDFIARHLVFSDG